MEKVYAQIISVSLMLTTICGGGLSFRCTNSIVKQLLETVDNSIGECKEELVLKRVEKAQSTTRPKHSGFIKDALLRLSEGLSSFRNSVSFTFKTTKSFDNLHASYDIVGHVGLVKPLLAIRLHIHTSAPAPTIRQCFYANAPNRAGPSA